MQEKKRSHSPSRKLRKEDKNRKGFRRKRYLWRDIEPNNQDFEADPSNDIRSSFDPDLI